MNNNLISVMMITNSWAKSVAKVNNAIDQLSEEQLNLPVVLGQNSPQWIIGHLAAVNDYTLTVLGIREVTEKKMSDFFTQNKEKNKLRITGKDAVSYWKSTLETLDSKIKDYTLEDWFSPHTAISREDFKNEPHRNKLNVILDRLTHMNHHFGQLVMLTKKGFGD